MSSRRAAVILLTAGLLLVIAISRLYQINAFDLNRDEIWSAWQTFGSAEDILRWTPYDWPPLYYLLLGGWRALTSPHPVILRFFSVLAFLVGTALLYRAARRLAGRTAGLLAAAAYAALGYGILLSLEVRGYALLLLLFPLAFWLMLIYFDQPRWLAGAALGGALAALFYTSLTSFGAFLLLGSYTLIVYPRRVWRWWLPGVAGGLLALPEIVNKAGVAVGRLSAPKPLPPLPEALLDLYQDWAGSALPMWAALGIAAAALLVRQRQIGRHRLGLLLWVLAGPIAMYLLHPALNFFSPRYTWWGIPGIALLTGLGLAALPRRAAWAGGALLAALALTPVPFAHYNIFEDTSRLGDNFRDLQPLIQSGDTFILDPSARCGSSEEWDYYLHVYFPNGLTFADRPTTQRRIWYIHFDGQQDQTLQRQVWQGRIATRFIGPPGCLFRLWEAPPDADGVLFENGMRFHGADILTENDRIVTAPLALREGSTLRLRLWWSVEQPPPLDYSVGLYITRGFDEYITNADSAPAVIHPPDAPDQTSQWQPGQYYVEQRSITLPYPTARSTAYYLWLAVYFWQDTRRLSAPGVSDENLLPLRRFAVMSY